MSLGCVRRQLKKENIWLQPWKSFVQAERKLNIQVHEGAKFFMQKNDCSNRYSKTLQQKNWNQIGMQLNLMTTRSTVHKNVEVKSSFLAFTANDHQPRR